MNLIIEIWNVLWQNTPFHWLISLLFVTALIFDFISLLDYWVFKRQTKKIEKAIKKIRDVLKQASQENFLVLDYNSFYQKHFKGRRLQDRFSVELEQGFDSKEQYLILLKYPSALSFPVPKSFWQFIPGILIALGVLGTFYGIQSGLSAIPLDTITENSDNLLDASSKLLRGMNTAFSTSLIGLATSSILSGVLALFRWLKQLKINIVRKNLDEISVYEGPSQILSRLDFRASTEAANTMGQVAVAFKELVESQKTLTSEAIGQEVGKVMLPVFQEIRDELAALREIKSDQGQEILKNLMEEQREKLIKPIIQELQHSSALTQDASAAVRELRDQLGGITQSLAESVSTIQQFQQDTLSRLEDFADGLKIILNDFRTETQGVMTQVATEIQTAVAKSVQAMEAQRSAFASSADQAAATFRGIREDLQESLQTQAEIERQMLQEFQARITQIAQTQTEAITVAGQEAASLMNTARENLTATLSNIDEMLQGTRLTVQGELERFRLNYQAALEEFFKSQNQLLEETLGEQREGLAIVVQELNQSFTDEYQRRQALHENMEHSLSTTMTTINTVNQFAEAIGLTSGERLQQLKEITYSLGQEAQTIDKSYEQLIIRLNEALEMSNRHLSDRLEQVAVSEQRFFEQADEATAKIANQLLQAANYLVTAESNRRHTEG